MLTNEPPPDDPFEVSEPVRIHIPDEDDFDHDKHGMTGVIVSIHQDDAAGLSEEFDELHNYRYKVSLDEGGTFPARHRDLRPE